MVMWVFVEQSIWRKRHLNWGFGCYGLNGVPETTVFKWSIVNNYGV